MFHFSNVKMADVDDDDDDGRQITHLSARDISATTKTMDIFRWSKRKEKKINLAYAQRSFLAAFIAFSPPGVRTSFLPFSFNSNGENYSWIFFFFHLFLIYAPSWHHIHSHMVDSRLSWTQRDVQNSRPDPLWLLLFSCHSLCCDKISFDFYYFFSFFLFHSSNLYVGRNGWYWVGVRPARRIIHEHTHIFLFLFNLVLCVVRMRWDSLLFSKPVSTRRIRNILLAVWRLHSVGECVPCVNTKNEAEKNT